jgi:anti-sigma B factor antagonist
MTIPGGSDGITIERHGEVTVVSFAPSLGRIEADVVEDVAGLLTGYLDDSGTSEPQVVVDLGAMDYFGSSFIGLLLRIWKQITTRGGQVVLCGVSPQARDLLHITSLDMVWAMFKSRREAVAALESD